MLTDILCVLVVLAILCKLTTVCIPVSVCVSSLLKILNVDITGLFPLRRNRRYHFKVGIKDIDITLTTDSRDNSG